VTTSPASQLFLLPAGLQVGTGKSMRHVKIRPQSVVDATALTALVKSAYTDIKSRLQAT